MPDLEDFDPENINVAASKEYGGSIISADESPGKSVAPEDSVEQSKQSVKSDAILSPLTNSHNANNLVAESIVEHAPVQGAVKPNNNKTLCRYYQRGYCRYGDLCQFQHSDFVNSSTIDVSVSAVTFLQKSEDESPRADDENDQNSPRDESRAALLEALCLNTDDDEDDDDFEDDDLQDDYEEAIPTCYCCYHS